MSKAGQGQTLIDVALERSGRASEAWSLAVSLGVSLTDLIEVASMAYVSDMIVDDDGNNCTFILLVKSLCTCFGLRVPRNPWCYLQRIHMRKNMRSRAFFDRYCWLMYKMGQSHPLLLSVHLPTGLCTSAFE